MSELPMSAEKSKPMSLSFDFPIWTIECGGDTLKLLFNRVDEKKEWENGNVSTCVYLNDHPMSYILPSQYTPSTIYRESDLGSFMTLQSFIKLHTDMVLLGATSSNVEFGNLMKEVAVFICGYYGLPEQTMVQIPFQDGSWVKQDNHVYYCHLRRMVRAGRFYTTRVRQTAHPGIEAVNQHQRPGSIDMVTTFYLASNISDEPTGKPVCGTADGEWPKTFNLGI